MSDGNLFIVSGPSGAGKTSLVRAMTERMGEITISISHTTRKQRPGEIHGQDYFFTTMSDFQKMIHDRLFLEYAQVFDHHYGTKKEYVASQLTQGFDVILEIDWQGAQQVQQSMPEAKSIFILPPSLKELRKRLRNRGQDDDATVQRRMSDAIAEISHYRQFEYLIVNEEFERTAKQLESIIDGFRLKLNRQAKKLAALLNDLQDENTNKLSGQK